MSDPATPAAPPKKSGWINIAVDYGPVLVFFLAYRHFKPEGENSAGEVIAVIKGTLAFMVAALIALIVSRWKLGRVSPMLALSTALIVFFGTLTVFFQDELYIQLKPTAIYLFFGAALLIGLARGKSLLKVLLEAAFEGLDDAGWRKLSRNWGWFFIVLALLNEGMRHWLSFGDWLAAKLYVFMPLSFLFTLAHMPMLMRHGLAKSAEDDVLQNPPHE